MVGKPPRPVHGCADAPVGRQGKTSSRAAWLQACVRWTMAKRGNAAGKEARCGAIPPRSGIFRTIRENAVMRHTADYHPESSFDKREVMDVIDESRRAIDGFLAAPPEDRRAFAVYLPTKVRSA